MSDLPEAYFRHVTSDRIRIKIPSKKRNQEYFSLLEEQLSRFKGIQSVKANPLTGSLLMLHTEEFEGIEKCAEALQLFKAVDLEAPSAAESQDPPETPVHGSEVSSANETGLAGTPLLDRVVEPLKEIDERTRKFTNGELDVASLTFLSLFAVGLYEILRGGLTAPPWYTAFWLALNIRVLTRNRLIRP